MLDGDLAVTFGLTRRETKVFAHMLVNLGIYFENADDVLFSSRAEADSRTTDATVCLRSSISALRKKMRPFGVAIESRPGIGYYLNAETKKQISGMIGPNP